MATIPAHNYSEVMFYQNYEPSWGPVTRAGYGREPYIRITLPDGRIKEGRAYAWTNDKVLAQWPDHDAPPRQIAWMTTHVQESWIDAYHLTRIPRREATMRNPYDDTDWFQQQGEL